MLGTGRWLLGPAAIFVVAPRRSVFGIAIQNLWSVDGNGSHRPDVNALNMRALVNINLPREWFIVSKPNITANWEADDDSRWLVEAGGGIGKIFRIGRFGVALETQFFAYPVRPVEGPSWSIRFDLRFFFRRGFFADRVRERREQVLGRGKESEVPAASPPP